MCTSARGECVLLYLCSNPSGCLAFASILEGAKKRGRTEMKIMVLKMSQGYKVIDITTSAPKDGYSRRWNPALASPRCDCVRV
uniref:Putative secreted protein n=1 Tax=Anopheles darlingi TaxID=43151 RepID=A0A2M4D7F3_ANODA